MPEINGCEYWCSESAAKSYRNFYVHNGYVPTVMKFILEYYKQKHPSWVVGVDKIPYIIDVACGSGILTTPLAEYGEQVFAFDKSPQQIEMARNNCIDKNIVYHVGAAESMSKFCTQPADLIVIGMAAHFFVSDEVYTEVERCLKPDGVLIMVGMWYEGIDNIESNSFRHYFSSLIEDNCIDDVTRLAVKHLKDFYKDLYCPMFGKTRRIRHVDFKMSREDIRKVLMGINFLMKNGDDAVNLAVDNLPEMESYKVMSKVFAVQWTHEDDLVL